MLLRSLIAFLGLCFTVTTGLSDMVYAQNASSEQVLDARQQSIIPIAAFTAKGDVENLKAALAQGLQNGMTVSEIREVLVQMYAYAGFPRSLTGLDTFIALLDERKAQGIHDEIGKDATPLPDTANIRELGTANQTAVIGRPASGRIYEFAPIIDTFLKEHLFGDIFSRDVLSFQERELATVSALASLPAETQLRSHLKCCLVVGWNEAQMKMFVSVLETNVGKAEAELAERSLAAVLQNRARSK
ncbi:MAG TPA: carboxymuconolactone decarboxylase family protein [Candidatus Desulfovibrio gallistercoris]|nr:carboxymuconolactone decarboxylase family protein [Candidatus Desulfovibrio gallistercoris]